jgi:hypothetical protein
VNNLLKPLVDYFKENIPTEDGEFNSNENVLIKSTKLNLIPSDFGIEMYQGNLTTINYQSLNVSYIINPHTNLKFKLGVTLRDAKNDDGQMQTKSVLGHVRAQRIDQ